MEKVWKMAAEKGGEKDQILEIRFKGENVDSLKLLNYMLNPVG